MRRSKKISKLRVTGFCAGNSSVTGEFPAQMASNADNAPIWWRHQVDESTHVSTTRKGLRVGRALTTECTKAIHFTFGNPTLTTNNTYIVFCLLVPSWPNTHVKISWNGCSLMFAVVKDKMLDKKTQRQYQNYRWAHLQSGYMYTNIQYITQHFSFKPSMSTV